MNIGQATAICIKKFTKFVKNLENMFTLDGGLQLIWAAFDMPVTVVPLKVALGLEQNSLRSHLTFTCVIIFLKCPKIYVFQS